MRKEPHGLILFFVCSLLFIFLVTSAKSRHCRVEQEINTKETSKPDPSWTFEGCVALYPTSVCSDVFVDTHGSYWICGACGTSTNPKPIDCTNLTQWELESGYWCH